MGNLWYQATFKQQLNQLKPTFNKYDNQYPFIIQPPHQNWLSCVKQSSFLRFEVNPNLSN